MHTPSFNAHLILVQIGEVVGAAGTEGSSRTANKKVYNGKVSRGNV